MLEGALEHKDSMGNGSVIRPGDVQRMSAGTGIRHSEANPSRRRTGASSADLDHARQTRPQTRLRAERISRREKRGKLRLIASPNGENGSVTIHQDAKLYVSLLEPGDSVESQTSQRPSRVAAGSQGLVDLNGKRLNQGDGAAISEEEKLQIKGNESAEVLLFDLA